MAKSKPQYGDLETLRLLIRASDKAAIQYVAAVLKKNDGNESATCRELGVPYRTWQRWKLLSPEFGAAADKHAQGRADDLIEFRGEMLTRREISRRIGVSWQGFLNRLERGLTGEALFAPGRKRPKRARKKRAARGVQQAEAQS